MKYNILFKDSNTDASYWQDDLAFINRSIFIIFPVCYRSSRTYLLLYFRIGWSWRVAYFMQKVYCVVFRMDDIQDVFVDKAQIAAMNLFISKDQSCRWAFKLKPYFGEPQPIHMMKNFFNHHCDVVVPVNVRKYLIIM